MNDMKMTRRHISTSIDGLLAMSDYRLKKMLPFIKDQDGKHPASVGQLRKSLLEEKAMGHRLIAAEGCTNFDPVEGCLGCPIPEKQEGDG